MRWVDAGMPDVDFGSDAERTMLQETVDEAGKQGAFGYIDDSITTARDWKAAVEDVRVPTKIMGADLLL